MAPRVPVYDQQQTRTEALPAPRVSVDTRGAFGGIVGEGLQQLGAGAEQAVSQFEQLRRQEKEKADAIATAEAEAKFNSARNERLYNRDTGLLNLQGKAALDATQGVYTDLEKSRQELAKGLTNDEQRRLFMLRTGGSMEDVRRQGETHFAREKSNYGKSVVDGLSSTAMTAITSSYADQKTVDRQIASVEGPLRVWAKDAGLSPEETESHVARWRAAAQKARITQALSLEDADTAKAIFSQVKDELGPDGAQLQHAIQLLDGKQEGDRTALTILRSAKRKNGFIDDGKVAHALEALPAGSKKDQTELALQKYVALERQAENDKVNSYFRSAFSAFLKGHSITDVPATTKAWLVDNAPEEWAKLEQLQESWRNRGAKEASPKQNVAWAALQWEIAQKPEAYANMSLEDYAKRWSPALTEKDWMQGAEKIAELKAHANKPDGNLDLPVRAQQVVIQRGKEAGLFDEKGGPDQFTDTNAVVYRDVQNYVIEQERAYKQAHAGGSPPLDQYDKWASDRLLKMKVPGRLWGLFSKEVTRAEVENDPEYIGKEATPVVSDGEKKRIEQALRSIGAPVNDAAIDRTFRIIHGLPVLPAQAEEEPLISVSPEER